MSNAFTEIFGDTPRVRLLDFVAEHLEFDYTISQLSEGAHLSRHTVYALVERLTEDGLLVHTRTVGRSRFYRIDRENLVVLSLLRLDFAKARDAAEAAYKDWRRARTRSGRGRRVPQAEVAQEAGGPNRTGTSQLRRTAPGRRRRHSLPCTRLGGRIRTFIYPGAPLGGDTKIRLRKSRQGRLLRPSFA